MFFLKSGEFNFQEPMYFKSKGKLSLITRQGLCCWFWKFQAVCSSILVLWLSNCLLRKISATNTPSTRCDNMGKWVTRHFVRREELFPYRALFSGCRWGHVSLPVRIKWETFIQCIKINTNTYSAVTEQELDDSSYVYNSYHFYSLSFGLIIWHFV